MAEHSNPDAGWLAEFEAAARRPLALRWRYAFIHTRKPVLDRAMRIGSPLPAGRAAGTPPRRTTTSGSEAAEPGGESNGRATAERMHKPYARYPCSAGRLMGRRHGVGIAMPLRP